MKIKYLALALLCAACTSQKPREIPVWDFTSDDPSAESPSESPSDSPSEEPSKDEPVPEKEYELTDLLVIDKVTATDCSIVVEYSFPKASKVKGCKWGLGWNAGGEDIIQWGPAMDSDGKVFQVISDALLDFGKTYSIRAFVDKEGKTLWTEPSQAAMKDAPAALELEWNKLSRSVLPDGIELYETTSKVSERNFHAWYALADLGKVDLRVNVPSEAITIDDQSAAQDDCMVMINGGYFYNGRHTGLAVTAGKENGAIPSVRGSLRSGDEEFNIMYNVTRGIFGVDAQGRPAVYWAGTGNSFNFYFDRPLPSVRGESKYGAISVSNPAAPVDWKPEYALSAGPVLLKDGKIPFNFEETDKGTEYYLNNFEIMPYDIFGPGSVCDRTAVGYREDGKVVLFICDGRITASPGLNLVELARVMKGLGCKDAVNFDGGGSTGMMVGTEHIGDQTAEKSRKVVSTIGLYKR